MDFKDSSLKEYYFLRRGESFSIDPWKDSAVFFGEAELKTRISKRIESDFVQPRRVPKFFLFGAYGSGKTHALAHIAFRLAADKMYPAEPIYLAMPPLTAKEQWVRIHTRLIDAVGMERVHLAAETIADKIESTDKIKGFLDMGVLPDGDETLKTSQANVFRNFLFGGRQSQLSWEWLKGRKNTPDQATMLGVQKDISEATDLVSCLMNLGALYLAATGRKIIFLVDEAEAVRSVTNADSQDELQHMFRLLLENNNTFIGLILAIQSEGGMDSIGEFFTREDIYRRVDFDQGYIDLGYMVSQVQSAQKFMLNVLEYLIDQDEANKAINSEKLGLPKEYFPFTKDAINAISNHVNDNPQQASPAFILSTMSSAAIEAWRRREKSDVHVLIDTEIIEETIFPGG